MSDAPDNTPPLRDWSERCCCPFCGGTGVIVTPKEEWGGRFRPPSPLDTFRAGLSSQGWIPGRLEELREYGTDCLSHLSNDTFAARESLYKYLFVLWDLLFLCGADEDTCEVLEVLQYALQDSQRGVENPLLATEKKARARSQFDFEVLINASAAITALMDMDDGKSEKEAAKMVATKLNEHGLPLPDSYQTRKDHIPRPDWERLLEWRRKCSSGRRGEWAKRVVREWAESFLGGLKGSVVENIDEEFGRLVSKKGHFSP